MRSLDSPIKILAVDPSLTQSGWAVFHVDRELPVCWGTIKSPGSGEHLAARLQALHAYIAALYDELALGPSDFVVCEGPAPVSLNPDSAIKVEQVRCIFETIGREREVQVPGRLNPRTVQSEILGLKGKQLPRAHVKQLVRDVLERMYANARIEACSLPQDVCDAMLIGTLARQRISTALRTGVSVYDQFSVSSRRGSALVRGRRGRSLRWDGTSLRIRQ